jgi:hypothetical protein
MNKYEQLIEHIINDNEQAARAIFHSIVVEKSRDIYESLMDEEMGGNPANQFVDNISQDVQSDEQGLGEEEDYELDLDGADDHDMDSEEGSDDLDGMGHDSGEEGEGSMEDRVMDLETELDSLKAEFEALMAGEEAEEHDHPGIHDIGGDDVGHDMGHDMGGEEEMDEMGMMEAEEMSGSGKSGSGKSGSGKSGSGKSGSGKPFESVNYKKSQAEIMKEYVDKVKDFYKGDAAEGDTVGTGGDKPTVNKSSIVASKNDMGGTTANIAKGGANPDPSGTPPAKTSGLLKQGGEIDVAKRNVNKVGGNKGAQNFFNTKETSWEKAHGKEGQTTDGSEPVSKTSPLRK